MPLLPTTPLGAGGMGEVYRAKDLRLNRDVAIKVLLAALSSDSESLHRFQQEAQARGRSESSETRSVVGQPRGYLQSGRVLYETLSGKRMPVDEARELCRAGFAVLRLRAGRSVNRIMN